MSMYRGQAVPRIYYSFYLDDFRDGRLEAVQQMFREMLFVIEFVAKQ